MCNKVGNTCGQLKNRNLVCAIKLETHADNSKTRIWYVRKSWKHMRTTQKQEFGMCNKAGNTCGQFKNRNLVCAISWKHMRTIQKQELGMYNKSDNTYL